MPKRAATTTKEGAAKCQRTDVDSKYAPLIEAIHSATEIGSINQDVAKMFISSLPSALDTTPADRHKVQDGLVSMVERVMDSVKANLQERLDVASNKVGELEATKDGLDGKVQEVEETLTAATSHSEAKAGALADAMVEAANARTALEEARAAQCQGQTALAEGTEQKETFTGLVENHFKVLQAGELDAEGLGQHKDPVLPILAQIEVEDSCRVSFPLVCVKPSTSRTSFDTMVMHAVVEAVEAKSKALVAKVNELAAATATQTSSVEAAQAACDAAQAKQRTVETEEAEAVASEKEAKAAVKATKQSRKTFDADFKKASAEKASRAEELESFVSHNLGSFERLRDGNTSSEMLDETASVGGA